MRLKIIINKKRKKIKKIIKINKTKKKKITSKKSVQQNTYKPNVLRADEENKKKKENKNKTRKSSN